MSTSTPGSLSGRPKTNPSSLTQQPTNNYGTIKLVGVTAEEMMAKWEAEEALGFQHSTQRNRGTVEDIAGLMQTSQRAQNKGKLSFWEKTQERKAEKDKLKKLKKEEKKKAKDVKEKLSGSSSFPARKRHARELSEGSNTPLKAKTTPPNSLSSRPKPKEEHPVIGKMFGGGQVPTLDRQDSGGRGGFTDRSEKPQQPLSFEKISTMFVERDTKADLRADTARPSDSKVDLVKETRPEPKQDLQGQTKPKLWKTLTRTTKKRPEHEEDRPTLLAKYLTTPKQRVVSRENSERRSTQISTSDKDEEFTTPSDPSLNVLAINLETLESELKSSTDEESSSSSATPDSAHLASETTDSKSIESIEESPFSVEPGTEVTILEKLGRGATAIVWKAREFIPRGIKSAKINNVNETHVTLDFLKPHLLVGPKTGEIICKHEYDLVKSLSHPNIIKYHGIIFNPKDHEVNLFMELIIGPTLTDLVLYSTRLQPTLVAYILEYLLRGIAYLHSQCVIHRDVKPDNILLSLTGSLKIVDFGTFSKDTVANISRQRSTVGTPWYCAPEIINGEDYSNACDIWSIGCIVIEMVGGKPPFEDLNDVACLFKMAEGVPPPFPPNATPHCNEFLSKTLAPDWKNRPSAAELLGFDFVTSFTSQRSKTRASLLGTLAEMQKVQSTHLKKKFERLTQRITMSKDEGSGKK